MSTYQIRNPNAKWSNFDEWHVRFRKDSDTRVDVDHVLWCSRCQMAKACIEEVFCDSTNKWSRIRATKPTSVTEWASDGRCPVFLLGMSGAGWDARVWMAKVEALERVDVLTDATSAALMDFLGSLKCPGCGR